jgi:hypothetical protein
MATPLRKDQPEFQDEENITTADLAEGKRPASEHEMRGPQPVESQRDIQQGTSTGNAPLFPNNELESLRTRWKEIQTAFVDEPRKAVEQADGLVASAMKRLAEIFAQERSGLEKQWDRGDNVSTEDLRVALQRYRSFFDRLLSV